jgi:hypothetical protein
LVREMSMKFGTAEAWATTLSNAGPGGATDYELKTLGFHILVFTFFSCRVLGLFLQTP